MQVTAATDYLFLRLFFSKYANSTLVGEGKSQILESHDKGNPAEIPSINTEIFMPFFL